MQVIFGLLLYIAMHAASKSCFTFIVAFLKNELMIFLQYYFLLKNILRHKTYLTLDLYFSNLNLQGD